MSSVDKKMRKYGIINQQNIICQFVKIFAGDNDVQKMDGYRDSDFACDYFTWNCNEIRKATRKSKLNKTK